MVGQGRAQTTLKGGPITENYSTLKGLPYHRTEKYPQRAPSDRPVYIVPLTGFDYNVLLELSASLPSVKDRAAGATALGFRVRGFRV